MSTPIICYNPATVPIVLPPPSGGGGGGGMDLSNYARLDIPDVFNREITTSGFRLGDIKAVSANYSILPTDAVILVDATGGTRTITLPASTGNGQILRIKKVDTTTNAVVVTARSGDSIDGVSTVRLVSVDDATMVIDVLTHLWDLSISPTVALTDQENFFAQATSLSGLRLSPPKLVTTDNYFIQSTDTEILVDSSVHGADLNLILPVSGGSGQLLHIKKVDDSVHLVNINATDPDQIDGASSVSLNGLYADALLIAGGVGYWDNTGPTFSNAMFLPFYGTNSRTMADGTFYLFNPDQSKFHALAVRGAAGAEYITLGAGVP